MSAALLLFVLQHTSGLDASQFWDVVKSLGSTAAIGTFLLMVRLTLTVRDVQRDLRGNGDGEGLIRKVARHERRLDVIEDWKIALDAVADVERREHTGPDRRVGARRKLDVAHEVLDERVRRMTDEHSSEDDDP